MLIALMDDLARGAVLAERPKEYVQAARVLGATHARVLRHHIRRARPSGGPGKRALA